MNPDTDGLSDDEDGEQKDHSHLRTTLSNLQEAKKPEVKFQKYLKHEQEKMKYIELENEHHGPDKANRHYDCVRHHHEKA